MEEKNLSESVTMSVREKTGEEHRAKRTCEPDHFHIPLRKPIQDRPGSQCKQ